MKNFKLLLLLVAISIVGCSDDDELPKTQLELEIEQLQTAMTEYKDFDTAKANGYDVDVTGYRTQMGHHFLNATLLDNTFELEKPEVLLYSPDENGGLRFVAAEYGIPITDMNNPPPPPEGFTGSADVWEINTEFNLWTLHVWIELENPDGIFKPRNPILP
ncbi:MAG: hypothetical protein QNJ57_05760 [Flavobacteriaceae bacterium]|nr:hypothetical protein [Flavobacteriaceae bacterium]